MKDFNRIFESILRFRFYFDEIKRLRVNTFSHLLLSEYKCYKQLEKMKSHFEANPMWDFLHGEYTEAREHELNKTFHNFQKKHKKSYTNHTEARKRKDIFRHNQRYMYSPINVTR